MNRLGSSVELLLGDQQIRNDECPICWEKFKVGDDITYGCEAKHLHHTSCFNEMKVKNQYSCSICRSTEEITFKRRCYPCACCKNPISKKDEKLIQASVLIPFFWCIVNIGCPFLCIHTCAKCMCTKEFMIESDNIVNTKLSAGMSKKSVSPLPSPNNSPARQILEPQTLEGISMI